MVLLPFRTVLPQTEEGLVLYLTGNAGAGKIMHDCSPMGNNGRIHGATWTQGKFGKALKFDGVDDYVLAPLSHTNSITVAVWINYRSLPSDNPGVFQAQPTSGSDDTTKVVGIWVGNDGYLWGRLIQSDGTLIDFPKNKYLSPNTWYHIVLTADASTGIGKLWVNGEEISSISYDGTLQSFSYAKIGRQGTETWNGIIDEVRIYNRVLSEEEIRAHFKGAVIKLRP